LPFVCRGSTIDGVLKNEVGRLTMLHWKPRLVVLAAILALILLALGGLGFEDSLAGYNLYW
jgi:hypothetical protein